jgi:hypothetical protein
LPWLAAASRELRRDTTVPSAQPELGAAILGESHRDSYPVLRASSQRVHWVTWVSDRRPVTRPALVGSTLRGIHERNHAWHQIFIKRIVCVSASQDRLRD